MQNVLAGCKRPLSYVIENPENFQSEFSKQIPSNELDNSVSTKNSSESLDSVLAPAEYRDDEEKCLQKEMKRLKITEENESFTDESSNESPNIILPHFEKKEKIFDDYPRFQKNIFELADSISYLLEPKLPNSICTLRITNTEINEANFRRKKKTIRKSLFSGQ